MFIIGNGYFLNRWLIGAQGTDSNACLCETTEEGRKQQKWDTWWLWNSHSHVEISDFHIFCPVRCVWRRKQLYLSISDVFHARRPVKLENLEIRFLLRKSRREDAKLILTREKVKVCWIGVAWNNKFDSRVDIYKRGMEINKLYTIFGGHSPLETCAALFVYESVIKRYGVFTNAPECRKLPQKGSAFKRTKFFQSINDRKQFYDEWKKVEDKEASDSWQRLMERPPNRSIASYPPELLISI